MRLFSRLLAVGLLLLLGSMALLAQDKPDARFPFTPQVITGFVAQNQTTVIPTTMLFTPSRTGLYQVLVYWTMTKSGTGNGFWSFKLTWTDDAGGEQSPQTPQPECHLYSSQTPRRPTQIAQ